MGRSTSHTTNRLKLDVNLRLSSYEFIVCCLNTDNNIKMSAFGRNDDHELLFSVHLTRVFFPLGFEIKCLVHQF